MQLTDLEQRIIKNTVKKFAKVLMLAFPDKTFIYIGYYAFLTAQAFIERYFAEEVQDEDEFRNIKRCLLNDLSEYTKSMYAKQYKGEK